MSEEIKSQVDKLKAEVREWPNDQKASYIEGISEGLRLAMLIAEKAGCELAKDTDFSDLVNFLCGQKFPPMRKRNKATQKPKTAREQMFDDTKELVRRAIASRLGISKNTYDTSWDAWDEVSKCLLTVIAIARRNALDDAIADIQILRSIAGGGDVDRKSVKAEVESCYERFSIEIASIERFNELSKQDKFKHKDIWIYLRSNTPVTFGHDDDELREIDARYNSAA